MTKITVRTDKGSNTTQNEEQMIEIDVDGKTTIRITVDETGDFIIKAVDGGCFKGVALDVKSRSWLNKMEIMHTPF